MASKYKPRLKLRDTDASGSGGQQAGDGANGSTAVVTRRRRRQRPASARARYETRPWSAEQRAEVARRKAARPSSAIAKWRLEEEELQGGDNTGGVRPAVAKRAAAAGDKARTETLLGDSAPARRDKPWTGHRVESGLQHCTARRGTSTVASG